MSSQVGRFIYSCSPSDWELLTIMPQSTYLVNLHLLCSQSEALKLPSFLGHL